jgi:hypothetical protein
MEKVKTILILTWVFWSLIRLPSFFWPTPVLLICFLVTAGISVSSLFSVLTARMLVSSLFPLLTAGMLVLTLGLTLFPLRTDCMLFFSPFVPPLFFFLAGPQEIPSTS